MKDAKPNAACIKLLSLVVSAYGCALALLVAPRPVAGKVSWTAPVEPALDCQAAHALDPAWTEVRTLITASTAAELGPSEQRSSVEARQQTLQRAAASAIAKSGEAGLSQLQASATCALTDALHGRVPAEARAGILGRFLEELLREQVIDEQGRLLLPLSVAQALYSVRVNLQLGYSDLRGMSASQQRAYYGALVWHSPSITPARRLFAASAYSQVAGERSQEALAYALEFSDPARAAELYTVIYEATGELRARNAARALAP